MSSPGNSRDPVSADPNRNPRSDDVHGTLERSAKAMDGLNKIARNTFGLYELVDKHLSTVSSAADDTMRKHLSSTYDSRELKIWNQFLNGRNARLERTMHDAEVIHAHRDVTVRTLLRFANRLLTDVEKSVCGELEEEEDEAHASAPKRHKK